MILYCRLYWNEVAKLHDNGEILEELERSVVISDLRRMKTNLDMDKGKYASIQLATAQKPYSCILSLENTQKGWLLVR